MGTDQSPLDLYRVRAASLTIWSKAGWMKSANWISAIGMRPLSAAPIAMPTMPDSASGISRTRASPNFAYSPSVAPKTPPLRPTSSPMTSTRSSRSISSVMAARTASIIRISATLFIPRPHIVHRRSDGARALAPDLFVYAFIQDACGHQPTAHPVDRFGGEPVALGSGGRRCVVMLGIRESAREVLDQADERQRVGAREVDALVPVAGFEGVPVCANKSHSIATRDLFGVCDARGVQHVASGSGRGRHDARRPRAEHAPHDVERGCTKRETQGEVELARHHPVTAGSQCRRGRDLDDFEAGDSNRKIHLFETAQHPQAAFDGAGHDHRVIEREKSEWLKIGTGSARRHRLSRLHLWGGRG